MGIINDNLPEDFAIIDIEHEENDICICGHNYSNHINKNGEGSCMLCECKCFQDVAKYSPYV